MTYDEMYASAVKAGTATTLTPTFYAFAETGDTVVGEYRGSVDVTSAKNGSMYKHYIFQTDDGLIKFHLGAVTDSLIHSSLIPGSLYAVEFQGQVKVGGGKSVNKYNVLQINRPGCDEMIY